MVSKIENGLSVNMGSIERLAEVLDVEPVVELQARKSPDKDIIDYVMTAIIEFARRHTLSIREASNYLNRFKGIEFLSEFYDVEHTLSFNDCVEDLTLICQRNGGAIQCSEMRLIRKKKRKNAQFLFEGISSDVVRYLVERNQMVLDEAISTFHNSETFAKLEDFETGLYIESPAYVYDMLISELKHGKIS